VDDEPIQHDFADASSIPASDVASDRMSRELKRRGMKFVGPTICYALMQAAGLVNDHVLDCHRHSICAAAPPRVAGS